MKKPLRRNGKEYYWCSPETGGKCQGAWRRHKPSDCEGTNHKQQKRALSNDTYVPRRHRNTWRHRMIEWAGKHVQHATSHITTHIQAWANNTPGRRKTNPRTRRPKCAQRKTITAMAVLAMTAAHQTKPMERKAIFDTDSGEVGVDNRATGCISNVKTDFVDGTLKPCNRSIKGYHGQRRSGIMTGTLRWSVLDDTGMRDEFLIPKSFL